MCVTFPCESSASVRSHDVLHVKKFCPTGFLDVVRSGRVRASIARGCGALLLHSPAVQGSVAASCKHNDTMLFFAMFKRRALVDHRLRLADAVGLQLCNPLQTYITPASAAAHA